MLRAGSDSRTRYKRKYVPNVSPKIWNEYCSSKSKYGERGTNGKEVGLEYQMDTMILTNTFDAHRLTMFAKTQGLMKEMTERILHAYFTESKHIGDHQTLTELAAEVGLNREAVEKMLASDEMADAVRADEQTAKQYRITGVPFFLINKNTPLQVLSQLRHLFRH